MALLPKKPYLKVHFLGTGEACDPQRRNTSILVESEKKQILLDCGFSSAQAYFGAQNESRLDIIWLSHLHGDHFFGVPHLIVHFFMQGRTEKLTILSGSNCENTLLKAIDLAYPDLRQKLKFPLQFNQVVPGRNWEEDGISFASAEVNHSRHAYGVKLSKNKCSLYYSGDGKATPGSMNLMHGCDLVIHEAFSMKPTKPNHSSIDECLAMAARHNLPLLALVHINKATRSQLEDMTMPLKMPATRLLFPDDGETLFIP